ncbi:cytochrome P450 82A2 [Artemisia annua]|uniref:Cytochrome P450 82A2 n=1 Tax=Artemisia annua TaxID=35608 RepID=A0A2U1QH76_ARTAN|nr:cytochrome P450 82A2 [Artemisia annua]
MKIHLLISTVVIIIAITFVIQNLYRKWARVSNDEKKNPPQPKGALPLIGHLHLIAGRTKIPHKVLGNMAEACGPIFIVKLGVHQALVVSDAEIAKECFTKNDLVFATRPKSLVVELMGYNYAMFGLAPYGDYWRTMRKMVMIKVLSQRRVEMLSSIRVSEVRTSMKHICEAWVRNKESTGSNKLQVQIKKLFENFQLNIITRTVSGKRFSPGDEESARVLAVARKFLELLGTFVRWLEEHRKQRESGEQQCEGEHDFMNVFISMLEGASGEEFTGFDHITMIKATSLVILTGGLDTTHATLTSALSLLLNNPKALKMAQEELDAHVGRDRLVEESDITNLVYLQAIIKETLRLHPPAQISPAHESIDNCIVAGYNIPKGTRLMVNLWKLHRDPNVWSDPDQFQPERFLTSNKDIDYQGQQYDYLPFGSGRRICPGISFAIKTLHFTLASALQGFELAKPSNKVDANEGVGLTDINDFPLEVILSPRLSIDKYHNATE